MADFDERQARVWRDEFDSRRPSARSAGSRRAYSGRPASSLLPRSRRSGSPGRRLLPGRLSRQVVIALAIGLLLFGATRLPFGIGQRLQSGLQWVVNREVNLDRLAAGGQTLWDRWSSGATRLRDMMLADGTEAVVSEPQGQFVADPAPTQWLWPLEGEIRRGFGWHEAEEDGGTDRAAAGPGLEERYFMPGVEIASLGQGPVRAAAAGSVAAVQNLADGGWLVSIEHGGGWTTRYGGLDVVHVEQGDLVEPGQTIATLSAQPEQLYELYFEMEIDGVPVDPEPKLRRAEAGF